MATKLFVFLVICVLGAVVTTLIDRYIIGINLDSYAHWQRIAHQVLYMLWGGLFLKLVF